MINQMCQSLLRFRPYTVPISLMMHSYQHIIDAVLAATGARGQGHEGAEQD